MVFSILSTSQYGVLSDDLKRQDTWTDEYTRQLTCTTMILSVCIICVCCSVTPKETSHRDVWGNDIAANRLSIICRSAAVIAVRMLRSQRWVSSGL